MKRIVVCVLLAAAGLPAFAQRFIVLGANAGYGLHSITAADETSRTEILTHAVKAGIFADIGFLRAEIEYAFTPSKPLSVLVDGVQSAPGLPDDYWKMQVFEVLLLAKLPIPVGIASVWPAVGLLSTLGIYFDMDGDGFSDLLLNDYYLVGGVGADIPLTPISLLSVEALFELDFQSTVGWSFTSFSWFDVTVKVGAAIRL